MVGGITTGENKYAGERLKMEGAGGKIENEGAGEGREMEKVEGK